LIVGLRTSNPIRNAKEREEAQRLLADRRQRILHAVARMNGARGISETLAQKRIYIGTLPGMAEETKREQECLTLHAADLLPVEVPWQGLTSAAILLETPSRQMVPFSPFDANLGDANMLIMAKSGGGKTFMAQLLLLMLGRTGTQISILERGDSYRPLVELMGGRVIDINLDGNETLNPWDLPQGEKAPSKEKIAFLKNLTRHMIGDAPGSDTTLVDNVISEAIGRTYKRVGLRYANPVPTFSDLRDELAQWQDEEKMQRAVDEAKLAAIKLRTWTEKGIYSRLFDRHTNIRTENDWLFFNVEGLGSDPHLETAMSMLIANAMADRASGKSGRPSITVLDECWSLLDSPVLAPEVVQLFRTARKRNSSVWGISQTLEDFVGTSTQPRPHGPGIVKNANTKLIGQQPGDMSALENQLHLNDVALSAIKRFSSPHKGRYAEMLLVIGEKSETTQTVRLVPTPVDYWICTTYPRERTYRAWYLKQNPEQPLLDCYEELARRLPQGLAALSQLPEELSGAVHNSEARHV
jgi:type IV secretory pathway VirB4 component